VSNFVITTKSWAAKIVIFRHIGNANRILIITRILYCKKSLNNHMKTIILTLLLKK
jgi:hypothetical protein